jgi:hypothetical protein
MSLSKSGANNPLYGKLIKNLKKLMSLAKKVKVKC